ncbi:BTAD domain-containing putative transcriptional regulator [Streptomyces syringium]|uniref:BTAD domain-containing putative transcriptional regulator n=1 Tax=Streptomyces syringium TaxID=76729 RepID=UPI0033C51ADA
MPQAQDGASSTSPGTDFAFGVLGPLEVLRDGRPVELRAAKQRALLASLLIDANKVVPTETLMARLWEEEPPEGARNTLQNYVLRVRRALGPTGSGAGGPVLTCAQGYLVEVAAGALDLHRFDALVDRAKAAMAEGAPARASTLLGEALALWRGEPLSDVPSERLRREVVPALTERRLGAIELRTEADLQLGRHADVLPRLRELTATYPLQERFWAQRMLALYRAGRQGEALDCYRTVSELLLEELGVDPGAELWKLHQRILTADPALTVVTADQGGARTSGNLPAEMTSFVGRGGMLSRARRLLEGARLVTLTGPGGVGKTRLALRTAAEVSWAFPHGVWLADLAPLVEPGLLDREIAGALGILDQSARPGTQVLVEYLRERHLLLVLDNCEHVADAAGELLATLLRAAPGLRVLATSRQGLGVPGEHLLLVPPLDVPAFEEAGGGPPMTRSEAVRLLGDRAAASAPDFRITEENHAAVGQLCRRLDGIPLAIELAAVRLSTLSVEEVLERLDDRFRLLTHGGGARTTPRYQRTLRGVVDWSYDLCGERERLLWARLSVFAGGFDLEAAETVCSSEGADDGVPREDVIDILAALVHKSVLTAATDGHRTRYRMLETIRQYGQRRLRDLGQDVALRRRHCAYYEDVAARAAADWCGPREVEWLSRLRRELPNLRAALDFCTTGPGEARAGLVIAANLTRVRFWFFSSSLGEGRHWLSRTLGLAPDAPGPLRVGALALATWIALCQGDQGAAERFLADCRESARRIPDDAAEGALAYIEGAHAMLVQRDPRAIALFARARERYRRDGRLGDAHMATMLGAMTSALLGEREAALADCRAHMAEADDYRAGWAYSWGLWVMALAELRHGDPHRAAGLIDDSLRRQRDIGDRWGPCWGVHAMAWTAAALGDPHRGARLMGASYQLREAIGVALAGLRPLHDAHVEAERVIRGALDARVYAAAFAEGAAARDAVGLALDTGR